jgi:hypothetical protein
MPTHHRGTSEAVRAPDAWAKLTRVVASFGARLAAQKTFVKRRRREFR